MTDHRIDIKAYAEHLDADMRAMLAGRVEHLVEDPQLALLEALGYTPDDEDRNIIYNVDAMADLAESYVLETEHSAILDPIGGGNEPEETRLLLTFGGPNVRVTYSHLHETAELFHSWGREQYETALAGHEWRPKDRITYPLDAELVGEFVSAFFPHPLEV